MAHWDPPIKALFFDVFGTCVDWKTSVINELVERAQEAAKSDSSSIDDDARLKASQMTREQWAAIAHEWRSSYLVFTRKLAAADADQPYKTVDEHHLDSLREILTAQGLQSLYTPAQLEDLSLVWHRLTPWPDTVQGLHDLNRAFQTSTLSNGNVALLADLCRSGAMPFTHVFSAEHFQSYKPSPKVYLGAPAKLGLRVEECAMVAAHLDDLKAAKGHGLRTIYVQRPGEEWHVELEEEGRGGFVDVWVEESEEGFIEAAGKLGAV